MQVTILTQWVSDDGGNNTCDVAERYPGAWSDDTGQHDDQPPLETNVVVWRGEVDAATLAAMEADSDLIVMVAENTDETGAVIPGGSKPATANPTAQQRTALNAWLNAQHITGPDRATLVRAGVSRKTIADDIRAWAKERPRKVGD